MELRNSSREYSSAVEKATIFQAYKENNTPHQELQCYKAFIRVHHQLIKQKGTSEGVLAALAGFLCGIFFAALRLLKTRHAK